MNKMHQTIISFLASGLLYGVAFGAAPGDHAYEIDEMRKPAVVTDGNCAITNVTIHTAVAPAFEGSILVKDGKIAAIGEIEIPSGFQVIDGAGAHVSPGAVDNHSHMAANGINEGTLSITCDVDISDAINSDDLTIYRALSGGTTSARILHGSANTIGGRHEVIKMKWKRRADEIIFDGAPEGVKFALGENVKRAGGGRGGNRRFPATRMGVETIFNRAFERAREYQRLWAEYEAAKARGEDPAPLRRDVRLDALSGILDGSIDVHSHCYRADEIVMLMRVAERFGFRVKTLQHVLEGYKVAQEIAQHGAGGSTFSDWWAYKIEAYDAVPHNAGLMAEAGAVVSVNSDSGELVRRLFGEAAKSVRYVNMDPVEALKLVTLNSAIQLGIEDRVGSLEVGKDADIACFTGDPLSSRSRVNWTMVDGVVEFTRIDSFGFDAEPIAATELTEASENGAIDPNGGEVTALVGATLHPITSPDIENGTLVMQDGRIVAMGQGVSVPETATIIDVSGHDVWPGLIALNTSIGMHEIGSIRETQDTSEIGSNQPDLRTAAVLNAASAHVGVTRQGGVTRAQSAPQGGGPLRGQSCIIRLVGDTWEELVTLDVDMMHLSFPSTRNDAKDKKTESDALKGLRKVLEEAREYAQLVEQAQELGSPPPPYDGRMEALAPYARGEKRIAVHVRNAQTILFALKFAREENLDIALYGASEAWKVADHLAREQVPVVVGPILSNAGRDDPYDATYANPAVLARAGVPFAIMAADTSNTRNLPFHAAMAHAFGLPEAEALRAITYYPAQVLGVEKELGSLAPGKIADVVVTTGHLLEITSQVHRVYIDGKDAGVENRQTRLYDYYHDRLHRLQDEAEASAAPSPGLSGTR